MAVEIRTRNAEKKRTLVVRKAAQLFDVQGYHQTNMGDLADAVGIKKPTLYHYFSSKEEILFWIQQELIGQLLARWETESPTTTDPRKGIEEVIRDQLALLESHRHYMRVFFQHYRDLPARYRKVIKEKRDDYATVVETLIQRGVEQGEFRELDVRLTAFAIFGMCNWAAQWYRSQAPLTPQDIAERFFSLVTDGIDPSPKPATNRS